MSEALPVSGCASGFDRSEIRRRHRFPMGLGLAVAALLALSLPASAGTLDAAALEYRGIAIQEIADSLAQAKALVAAVGKGDLEGARTAWIAARDGWERSEPITGQFFPDLDAAIDAWPDATEGFHAIEAKLFSGGGLDRVAPMAAALVVNLSNFKSELEKSALAPQGLLDGVAGLAYEIGENKAGGGESPFSGNSLPDMRRNLEGIEIVYATVFAPALKADDAALAAKISGNIETLESMLKIPDLKSLDQDKFRRASEELTVAFQAAAPKLGLEKPALED